MNTKEFTPPFDDRQEHPSLTPADRRLLLGASLRVLSHRFSSGKRIRQDDVSRIAALADDAGMEIVAG